MGRERGEREREREREREKSVTQRRICKTLMRNTTVRQRLHVKFAISASHIMLTTGQPPPVS